MFYGPLSGTFTLDGAFARFGGDDTWDHIGISAMLAPGLMGEDDAAVCISALHYDISGITNEREPGQVAIWPSTPEGDVRIDDAPLLLRGKDLYGYAGEDLEGSGDFNGDGAPDLVVGEAGGGDDGGRLARA